MPKGFQCKQSNIYLHPILFNKIDGQKTKGFNLNFHFTVDQEFQGNTNSLPSLKPTLKDWYMIQALSKVQERIKCM